MNIENERLGIMLDKIHERDAAYALVTTLRQELQNTTAAQERELAERDAVIAQRDAEIVRLTKELASLGKPDTEGEAKDPPPPAARSKRR